MARRLEITKSILVLILAALLDFEVKGSSTVLCLSDLNLHFNDNWWVYVKLVHVKVSSFCYLHLHMKNQILRQRVSIENVCRSLVHVKVFRFLTVEVT